LIWRYRGLALSFAVQIVEALAQRVICAKRVIVDVVDRNVRRLIVNLLQFQRLVTDLMERPDESNMGRWFEIFQ